MHSFSSSLFAHQDNYFIKNGYRTRRETSYCDRKEGAELCQRDVYLVAADLAKIYECKNVLDLGCGKAEKTVDLLGHLNIIGVDIGTNIQHCERRFPQHKWINLNLDVSIVPPAVEADMVICSDVIEHVLHPEFLMQYLSDLAKKVKVIIISTPERDLVHNPDHIGPPKNLAHIREWNLVEFKNLLSHYGIEAKLGLVRSLQTAPCHTMIAVTTK